MESHAISARNRVIFLNECTEAPTCQYCMKKGHIKENCYKKNYDERGILGAVSFEALMNNKKDKNKKTIKI